MDLAIFDCKTSCTDNFVSIFHTAKVNEGAFEKIPNKFFGSNSQLGIAKLFIKICGRNHLMGEGTYILIHYFDLRGLVWHHLFD